MSNIAFSSRLDWNLAFLDRLAPLGGLVGRALMAHIFIIEGFGKMQQYSDVAAYMDSFGVNSKLLPLVIATEFGGGLMILLGFKTRWAAAALAGFAVLTALLFHANFSDADQVINFEKNLAIAGGFVMLAVRGPGSWSVDARLGTTY